MDQHSEPRSVPKQRRTRGTSPQHEHDPAGPRGEIHEDVASIRELHRRQVAFYRAKQKAIARLLGYGKEMQRVAVAMPDSEVIQLRAGLQQLTDGGLRAQLTEIDVFLARITRGALHAARAQEAAVAGESDAQLRATMREEFLRAAYTFTPDEWSMLDEVRRTQASAGGKAAMLVGRSGMRRLLREARERESDDETDEEQDG